MANKTWFKEMIEVLTVIFSEKLLESVYNLTHKAQDVVFHTTDMIMYKFFSGFMLLLAVLLLSLGAVMLIIEYALLSSGWALIIVGALIMFIAYGINVYYDKNKHYKF